MLGFFLGVELCLMIFNWGVTGGRVGWKIALPDFDRIEDAALLLAQPACGNNLRPLM